MPKDTTQKDNPQEIQQDSKALRTADKRSLTLGGNAVVKGRIPSEENHQEKLAGADENRTHRGRDTPPNGFEDRERHQTTNYSRGLSD